MPSGKVNIKTETCVLNVITDFNEEKQFLTIPHYLKVQSKSKKPKCFFSLSIITIFVLTILIFSTKSTIQTFIKEIRIKNIFSKEEYSEYLSISPNSKKLTWKNETIKYRQIKKEIHQICIHYSLIFFPKHFLVNIYLMLELLFFQFLYIFFIYIYFFIFLIL